MATMQQTKNAPQDVLGAGSTLRAVVEYWPHVARWYWAVQCEVPGIPGVKYPVDNGMTRTEAAARECTAAYEVQA